MTDASVTASFSFLLAGPTLTVQVPQSLEPNLELSSPVSSGFGARFFVFTAGLEGVSLVQALTSAGEYLSSLPDAAGGNATLLKRIEAPDIWWLVWELADGALTTHLRSEDGAPERATDVANGVEIVRTVAGTPALLMHQPLVSAVTSGPANQERARFASEDGRSLTFVRPGFVAEGESYTSNTDFGAKVRAGVGMGIEIQVSAPLVSDAQSILDQAISTLEEYQVVH
jgi:hypothetical protein